MKKRKYIILGVIIVLLACGIFMYSEMRISKGVVYDYIKARSGEEVADKVKIVPTLKYSKKFGYEIDVYSYDKITGINEVIFFNMKRDKDRTWNIDSIKTNP
ncbi:hypothetical protein [Clostridium sp. 'White wine YQ']|uniref:hypothetical protein n=1 Tax=Clostridium sp. 'White wine YQ' TaxID=3027474 RepID=UPI002365DC80|nr:hypothetical protein [Clostridium sp. 'White wine YQ']MDD7793488.1 hypothetical protein [Clostridium sp. 'White wine YQ']